MSSDEEKYFSPKDDPERGEKIEKAALALAHSNHLVVFTGAGISTESGLPDFRGPQGVWTLKDQGKRPKGTGVSWSEVEPNGGHYALKRLQDLGILKFLISQNVDNLHLKSGIRPELMAELHGNSTLMKCLGCNGRFSKEELGWKISLYGSGYRTQKPVKGQPPCPKCGERMISSVVNFGDPMPFREMDDSERHSRLADVFLAVGSSLSVTPASDFPLMALRKKPPGLLILINLGETPLDSKAHIHISGKAVEVLVQMVNRVEELWKSK